MKQRCFNPKAANYGQYGARGITVCDEWLRFRNFHADMGDPPSDKHTLDRIDNDRGYSKENCRWADVEEQQNNRTNSVKITAFGETLSVAQWVRKTGMTRDMICHRIFTLGMQPEEALTKAKMSHVTRRVVKKKDGKVVAVYSSLADAGRSEGCDRGGIWCVLAGKNKTAYGFEWEYID